MIFHWVVFVSGFIVAVAGGVSKTLDTLQWGCRRPLALAPTCIPSHPLAPLTPPHTLYTPSPPPHIPSHSLTHPHIPSHTLTPLRWDNTVLANISVAWVIINMVPFGMALGYAYLPHNKNVHGLLVSLSWTVYAMCVLFCVGAMITKVAYGNPKFM